MLIPNIHEANFPLSILHICGIYDLWNLLLESQFFNLCFKYHHDKDRSFT